MPDISNPCGISTAPIKKPKATLETSDLKLKEDKKRREHERNQNFQDLYFSVTKWALLGVPILLLILFFANYKHNADLANCVSPILSNLIACIVGSIIGKSAPN